MLQGFGEGLVKGQAFRFHSLGLTAWVLGFKVQGLGFGVCGLGFKVQESLAFTNIPDVDHYS